MIQITGNIWGTSGYAVHTKSLARALNKITEVKLNTQVFPNCELQLEDDMIEMIKRDGDPDVNIMIDIPLNWKLNLIDGKNIGFLVWEGDKIPKCWLEECLNPNIDMIFVPSTHTEEAIINAANLSHEEAEELINKIHIMPHGIETKLFNPKSNTNDEFIFLCNKGFRNQEDRGGIQYAVKAFLEEFYSQEKTDLGIGSPITESEFPNLIDSDGGSPDVQQENSKVEQFNDKSLRLKTPTAGPILIIKVNPAYPVGILPQHPKIKVISENMPYEKIPELYHNCDVFLAPTRAEAFNIPCLEAMACGKPVITTDFGGQTDYVPKEWQIGGELKEVEHEIMYEETRWLTPNIEELKKKMREFYNNKPSVNQDLIKEYTWENTAKKIFKLIKKHIHL